MKLKDVKIEISKAEAKKHVQYRLIPEHILDGVYNFVEEGYAPGHFLSAVFSNDLEGAVGRADKEALACLAELVIFIHNRVPTVCYKIHGECGLKAVGRWIRWHRNEVDEINPDEE